MRERGLILEVREWMNDFVCYVGGWGSGGGWKVRVWFGLVF